MPLGEKHVFVREVHEFVSAYPDWLVLMEDGTLAPVSHVTHEERNDSATWMLHTDEQPSRQIEYSRGDELVTLKPGTEPST